MESSTETEPDGVVIRQRSYRRANVGGRGTSAGPGRPRRAVLGIYTFVRGLSVPQGDRLAVVTVGGRPMAVFAFTVRNSRVVGIAQDHPDRRPGHRRGVEGAQYHYEG